MTSEPNQSRQSGPPEWALDGAPLWARTALIFVLAALFFAFLYAPSPLLYDSDSYFHLAIAKQYLEEGISSQLEWVRFGLLAEQFGDKEFLFHAFLGPFASWFEPSLGGRLALGLLGALILTTIGHLSLRAIGNWGLLVPFWLLFGSMEMVWRIVRLRAELGSILLLLLALWAAARQRYLWLGVIAVAYALAYTAIHAFVGLFGLIFLVGGLVLGKWVWRVLVYPMLGAGIGWLIHPQFPNNLAVWWYQSIEYFRFKGLLDVGTEIRPATTDVLFFANLGWVIGLAIIWRASEKRRAEKPPDAALVFGVAGLVFAVLYLLMSRFASYAVPLITLAVLFEMHRQGRVMTSRVRLPWRGSLHIGVAWIICFLVCLPIASRELMRYRQRNDPGPDQIRITDRQEIGRVLPPGAKALATWKSTPLYIFWAPQGRYVNVLDPVFLAAVDPPAQAAQSVIFSGAATDPVMLAAEALDSDFIVYSTREISQTLTQRLLGDPRADLLHRQLNAVFRLRPAPGDPFVLGWRLVPSGHNIPVSLDVDIDGWPVYPLREDPKLAALEGYVDLSRLTESESCVALAHDTILDDDTTAALEFAAAGPSTVWLDEAPVLQILDSPGAVLGRGAVLHLELAAGVHRMTVLTCPDGNPVAQGSSSGFYLLRRGSA